MEKLNLPEFDFRIKDESGQKFIFDNIRKKYIKLTPEEWVRQHLIYYLNTEKKYPASLTSIEREISVNKLKRRYDILMYSNTGNPLMIVECKAPKIKISQDVFDQISVYNIALKAEYLLVSNGMQHFCAKIDLVNKDYSFLKEIPDYKTINP